MKWIMLSVCLIMIIAMHLSIISSVKKGFLILGVKIPKENQEDEEIIENVTNFKYECRILFIVYLLLAFVSIAVAKYISLLIFFVLIYSISVIGGYTICFNKYNKRILALKKRKDWQSDMRRIVTVDTELSRLKGDFPVSAKWFVPVPIICLVVGYFTFKKENIWDSSYSALLGVIFLIFMTSIVLYAVIVKTKVTTYCENTDINIKINGVFKREWTRAALISSYSTLMFLPLLYNFSDIENMDNGATIYIGLIIAGEIFLSAVPMFYAYMKVENIRNRFAGALDGKIVVDEDDCWRGMNYYNPYDRNVFVEKRVGIGVTVNMATFAGKVFSFIILLVIIGVAVLGIKMIPVDFGEIEIHDTGKIIRIEAPLYDEDIKVKDIVSIKMIDKLPNAVKVNGVGTDRISLGAYRVKGYGNSGVYVKRSIRAVLVIELKSGKSVFLNCKDIKTTKNYYKRISSYLN